MDMIDAHREQRRFDQLRILVEHLRAYLVQNKVESRARAIQVARDLDNAPGRHKDIAPDVIGWLNFIDLDNDQVAWAQVLLLARWVWGYDYDKIKAVSPFADQLLLFVNYRSFASGLVAGAAIAGDLEAWLKKVLEASIGPAYRGMGDNWVLVTLPGPDTQKVQVIRCQKR